jgi:hypothetical protein
VASLTTRATYSLVLMLQVSEQALAGHLLVLEIQSRVRSGSTKQWTMTLPPWGQQNGSSCQPVREGL